MSHYPSVRRIPTLKTLPIILLVAMHTAGFCQTTGKSGGYDFAKEIDTSAEYPGGLPKFYEYLRSVMVYPLDARVKGIEGKTYVQFIVDASGDIIVNSVKTIGKLYPSCDAEAVRVVAESTRKWKPALKNGKAVNQQFVLPIAFKMTDNPIDPWHPIERSIKTVVIPKTFETRDSLAWTLYSDFQMQSAYGRVFIGDSVHVTGWAPWAYYIETRTGKGYISWKALALTKDLKTLSSIIAARSPIEMLEIEKLDTLKVNRPANAFLSVETSQQTVYAGECIALTLAFHVAADNQVTMQFYDLGPQLADIVSTKLTLENCWIINENIDDIVGISNRINGTNYTTYPIYKAAYCPVNSGTLAIPSIKLNLAKINPISKAVDSFIAFTSSAISVKVNALPPGITPTPFDSYSLVGNFALSDSLHNKNIRAGQPNKYFLTLRGKGLTYPVQPPKIKIENVEALLDDIIESDTIIENELQSSKTFVYQLIFKQPGTYDFNGKISFQSFDPWTRKMMSMTSKRKVIVSVGTEAKKTSSPTFGSISNFIAIDVSQSMAIEDYKPNRLASVKMGLKHFLMSRKTCDIGMILFGGNAKHFPVSTLDKCYTEHLIDSINFGLRNNGTAIGDAIWLANNSFSDTGTPKRLVIIGDGDNTAGHLPPKFAAAIAKKHNVKVYAIGVGNSGPVPYGIDENGKPQMIENTFADKDFKTIASITGGKYYWAKDAQEVERILGVIFSEP